MQLGAVLVCEAGPLLLRHGGIDVERLRTYTGVRIASVSRARERRSSLPFGALPFFVADPGFELEYHVRHASLPRPGDERALKRLAGRIFSEPLDPARPLWQLWVVEGLEGPRFALIAVCDAALAGAESRGDLVAALLARESDADSARSEGWLARAGGELYRRGASALQPARWAARAADLASGAVDLAEGLLAGGDAAFAPAAGALCRVDWLALDAGDVAAVRARLGGSERDVALAALAGGLRRLFERRGVESRPLRALTPICVEGRAWAPRVRLPVNQPEARGRLIELRGESERLACGMPEASAMPLRELARLAGAATRGRRSELVAAALPELSGAGAVLGARVRALVPILPPLPGQLLGVTVARCGDHVFVGLAASAARVPDLSALADGTASAFDELRRTVREGRSAARRARPRRKREPRARAELEAR
jgi:diacylglycerol O-acyltransferase